MGPDPLREDADVEVLWRSVQKSRKPIGLVLMDQGMVAGLGNIYRAEVLFKVCPLMTGVQRRHVITGPHRRRVSPLAGAKVPPAAGMHLRSYRGGGTSPRCVVRKVFSLSLACPYMQARVHPEQPANTVTRATFDRIWRHSVHLMQRGFATGSILTVDAADAAVLGAPWTRRYIYNHARCGVCREAVRSWDMANRTVYACDTCQPLPDGTKLTEARAKAMAEAADAHEFVSHCAADGGATLTAAKMTVAQLAAALQARCYHTPWMWESRVFPHSHNSLFLESGHGRSSPHGRCPELR